MVKEYSKPEPKKKPGEFKKNVTTPPQENDKTSISQPDTGSKPYFKPLATKEEIEAAIDDWNQKTNPDGSIPL